LTVTGKAPAKLGQWAIEGELLGSGGNADVWLGADPEGNPAALKVLRTHGSASERYLRFRRELKAQLKLSDLPGVLPVLDSCLPDQLSSSSPAWVAMPVAMPLRDALGDDPPVIEVVSALADIAETLLEVHNRGLTHRDIKPENLFRWNDHWVIGDFGLVDAAEFDALTEAGRVVGSRYYLAPEMISDPVGCAGAPCDVFALAKTLWVLLTGARNPLPGHMRVDEPILRASTYLRAERLESLDLLIDRATRPNPAERPDLNTVAHELRTWLRPDRAGPEALDLSGVAKELTAVMEPAKREQERKQDHERLLHRARMTLKQGLAQLSETAAAEGIELMRSDNDTVVTDFVYQYRLLRRRKGIQAGDAVFAGTQVDRPSGIGRPNAFYLFAGTGVIELEGDAAIVCAGHLLGPNRKTAVDVVWLEFEEVPLGSEIERHAVARLLEGLVEHLPAALARLTENLRRL
jgi:hypothetical protein